MAAEPEPENPWGAATAARRERRRPLGSTPGLAADRRQRCTGAGTATRSRTGPRRGTAAATGGLGGVLGDLLTGGGGRRQSPAEAMVKSAMRGIGSNVGRQVGNAIVRGVLGSILKR